VPVDAERLSLRSRLLAGFVGLTFALCAAEAVLRSTSPAVDGGLRGLHEMQPDRPWLYRLRPGAETRLAVSGDIPYRINSDGFRDRLYARPKPPGTHRIIVLGDSIAFGYGVAEDEAFPAVLEALLRARSSTRTEVLNFGVNGYNPYNEAALLAHLAPEYEPDLVLVQFCVNDLNDPTLHFDASTVQVLSEIPELAFPSPHSRIPGPPVRPGVRDMCGKIALCARSRKLFESRAQAAADPRTQTATFAPHDRPENRTEWRWLRDRYREMARTAAANGARFAVVVFPYQNQLGRQTRKTGQPEIARIAAQEGWEVADLLAAFRTAAAPNSEPLFLDLWHPTSAGHRIAAEAIAHELVCRALVPVRSRDECTNPRPSESVDGSAAVSDAATRAGAASRNGAAAGRAGST